MAMGQKRVPKKPIGKGKIYQNLRSLGVFFLTHGHSNAIVDFWRDLVGFSRF